MTENQFMAWLLFALPLLIFFTKPFDMEILIGFLAFSILPIGLFFMAENEFIKNCKKGYCKFEDSILPQFIYNHLKKELNVNE